MPGKRQNKDTKQRLVAAASELFAERGFHGTKIRDIAARARVNLAAANYHFGSKKELYLEVLREQLREVHGLLDRRGGRWPGNAPQGLSRSELVDVLRARIHTMLDLLAGPDRRAHARLMLREMSDPSEALPTLVEEFVRPLKTEIELIISHLEPELERSAVESCARSVVGQVQFYHFARPVLLNLMRRPAFSPGFLRELADFITRFSLGGIEALRRLKCPRSSPPLPRGRGGPEAKRRAG